MREKLIIANVHMFYADLPSVCKMLTSKKHLKQTFSKKDIFHNHDVPESVARGSKSFQSMTR